MKTEITHFQRMELKYLLTLEQKNLILQFVKNQIVTDKNGDSEGNYALQSVYYDTDDLKFYSEKVGHIRNQKLRIRRYLSEDKIFDENSKVFVEIKEKVNGVTQKRRVKMPYADAVNFIEKGKIPHHKESDRETIYEIYKLASQNILKPKALTSYTRQSFFGLDKEVGLRLTFDTNVAYQKQNISLQNPKVEGKIISENFTIMELKVNNTIPEFLQQFFEKNNIFPTNMSKYCQAIEEHERNENSLQYQYHQKTLQFAF